MKRTIIAAIFLVCSLTACGNAAVPLESETTALPVQSTGSTDTPPPFQTVTVLPAPTAAWVPLQQDDLGDWVYRCQASAVSFEVVEILPGVDAHGFLICGGFRIPAQIYDRNQNVLYFWGLLPLQDPDILDHLGERGVERLITVFELGETYLDADNLTGVTFSMSVNLPNDRNRAVFDTQNIGRFAGEYWGSQEAVDAFALSGTLPHENAILYPISLGVVR